MEQDEALARALQQSEQHAAAQQPSTAQRQQQQQQRVGTIRYDTINYICVRPTNSQLSLLHGTEQKSNEETKNKLEMWANAQRDGRPAEYRWCPLFNAAKFGWRPILECRAVMPQTNETTSAAGGPKFTIVWGHVGEILLLNKFFSDCRYMP